MNRWKELIVIMLQVRNSIMNADKNGLWSYELPEVACESEDIDDIENKLGIKLDKQYAEFLLCANGWKCFYQMVDLFGTRELISDKMVYAQKLLSVEVEFNNDLNELKDKLLPIAVSRSDKDIFVLVLGNGQYEGNIIWLVGGKIDRFDSFMEFFESMIEYNKEELEDIINGMN